VSQTRCGQEYPISPRDQITVPKNSTFSGTACLGCGNNSAKPMMQRLWEPSGIVFFGHYGTPIQLLRFAFKKRTFIGYPMCARCSRRSPKRVRAGALLCALAIGLIVLGFSRSDEFTAAASKLFGYVLLLTGLLTVMTRPFFFRCLMISKSHATVRRNPSWRIPK
jgi:hypothetical protein